MAELYLVALSKWPNDSFKTKAIRWFLHRFCERCYYAGEEDLVFPNSAEDYAELTYAITKRRYASPVSAITEYVHREHILGHKPTPMNRNQTFEDFESQYKLDAQRKKEFAVEQEKEWKQQAKSKKPKINEVLEQFKLVIQRDAARNIDLI